MKDNQNFLGFFKFRKNLLSRFLQFIHTNILPNQAWLGGELLSLITNPVIILMMKLSRSKLRALSTLSSNISEVSLAGLVIPAIVGVDKVNAIVIVLGLITFIIAGYLSLFFADKGKL